MSIKIDSVRLEEVPRKGAAWNMWARVMAATENGMAAKLSADDQGEIRKWQREVSRLSRMEGVKVATRTNPDEPGVLWVWRK